MSKEINKQKIIEKVEEIDGVKRAFIRKNLTDSYDLRIKLFDFEVEKLDKDMTYCCDCKYNMDCELQDDLIELWDKHKDKVESLNPILCTKFEEDEL
ncbi:MAG: hypothetical protein ACOC1X_02975 [Promethearchaeota archaeon]